MSVTKVIRMQEGERIIGIIRQFPLVHAWSMALALILLAVPFFLMVPLFSLDKIGAAIFGLLASVGTFLAVRTVVRWYWTALIVTSHRVVDVDQRGLFDRYVSEASYGKIRDVAYARRGIFGTIFDYGTIVVQTVGGEARLEQYYVRHPKDMHHLIVETMSDCPSVPSSATNGKVTGLLDAASSLSRTEARAFVIGLKGAIEDTEDEPSGVTDEDIRNFVQ